MPPILMAETAPADNPPLDPEEEEEEEEAGEEAEEAEEAEEEGLLAWLVGAAVC